MTDQGDSVSIDFAQNTDEREEIYRLRYRIYVEEMGRYASIADHGGKRLVEGDDAASHIIAASTLAIPVMIINETFLSFLGLGLRPPAISWGVLLQEAQNLQSIALAPWLLLPGLAVIITVLALNILGDGLRDAADPYS